MTKIFLSQQKENMISKTTIILGIFAILFAIYLTIMLWEIQKAKHKREAFSEKEKEEHKQKKEAFAEKQLEKNLFIINTFEDFYDRKITPDELKTFSEMFEDDSISEEVMKKKIETFESPMKTASVSKEHFVDQLTEISQKLNSVINAIKSPSSKKTPSEEKVETFVQGHEPFSKLNKYMPLQ